MQAKLHWFTLITIELLLSVLLILLNRIQNEYLPLISDPGSFFSVIFATYDSDFDQ